MARHAMMRSAVPRQKQTHERQPQLVTSCHLNDTHAATDMSHTDMRTHGYVHIHMLKYTRDSIQEDVRRRTHAIHVHFYTPTHKHTQAHTDVHETYRHSEIQTGRDIYRHTDRQTNPSIHACIRRCSSMHASRYLCISQMQEFQHKPQQCEQRVRANIDICMRAWMTDARHITRASMNTWMHSD